MAVAEAHIKAHENLGQGLFGVQLEITAKLLEAEKRKLTQLQQFQTELEDDKSAGVDRTAEVQRQKANYARLSSQCNRLAKEYEDAARGLLRRSTKQKKSSRSLPSLGFKQTIKARPTIFGNIVQEAVRTDESRKEANENSSPFFEPRLGSMQGLNGDVCYENGRILSGTLDALIKKLLPLPDYYPDRTYIFAFLLCCRLFISPTVLLSRVSSACAKTMKEASPSDAVKLGSNIVQLVSEWTETFTNDFRDEVMMMHFKDITSYCASLSMDLKKLVGQVTQALFCKLAVLDKYDEVLTQATAAAEDRRRTNPSKYKSLLDVCTDPSIMAQQLSHIELERLANIGPEEFVETFISRDDADFKSTLNVMKRTTSLEAYVEWFNRLGYLVATEICMENKKSVRAKKIDYLIEVANDCYDRGNFNSAMAIIAGMNMSPVARLKKTWSKVKNKKFDRLEREMNPASNFGAYRTSFKAAHDRKDEKNEYVIPFFGLFLKDVYFLNEGYNNRLPNGHINFEKFWQLSKVITEFVSWKETTISYERNGSILNYLMTAPLFSDNDLSLASYECESPETHFDKERQKSLKVTEKTR